MNMQLDGNIFYFLETDLGKWAFDNEKEAVSKLKEMVHTDEVNPEDGLSILEVDTTEQKWQIKEIPWSKIAMQLMKGD